MFKSGLADGLIDTLQTFSLKAALSMPLTLELAKERTEYTDRSMKNLQDGEYAYQARITSGNMHVAVARLEQAEQARKEGRTEDADRLQRDGEEHYRMGLSQTRALTRADALSDQNLPQEIKNTMLQDWAMAGRGDSAWSDQVYSGATGYMQNRAALESDDPRMRAARVEYLGYFSEMGERIGRGERFDAQFAATASHLLEPAASTMTTLYEGPGLALRLATSEGIKNQDLRKAMKSLSEDLEKLLKKASEGTATKDELEKAKEMSDFVKESEQILITVDAEGRPVVEKMLSRAGNAILSGKPVEAKVQLALAKEYTNADKEYRKKLEGWSDALASGKMSAAEVIRQMKEYRESTKQEYEQKPITEKSALGFVNRLEAFLKTRGFDKNKEYEKETKDIRELSAKGVELAVKAEKARKAGFEKEAKEYEKLSRFYLKVADARLGTLEYIQRLKDSKAPEFLLEAAKSAYWMLGTENDWKGKLIIKAASLFLGNKGFFSSEPGKGILGGFVKWLSGPKADQKEADEKFVKIEKESKRVSPVVNLDVESTVKDLEKAGAPKELIAAVKNAKSLIGTDQHSKAMFILAAAQYFLENKGRFKEKKGLLERFTAFVKMVSDTEKLSPEQQKDMNGYLEKTEKELAAAEEAKRQRVPGKEEKAEREPQPAPAVRKEEKQVAAKPPVKFSKLVSLRREKGAVPVAGRVKPDKQTESAAQALEQAGAPVEVVKALRENTNTDPRARAMMLDAAIFYANNIKTMNMPQMDQTKKFFEQLISGLGSGEVRKENFDKAEALLVQAKEFVGGFEKAFRSYMSDANQKSIDDMEVHRSYAVDPTYRKMLETFIAEARAFDKEIATGDLTSGKFDAYSKKLAIADQAGSLFLGIDDPDTRKAVEPFLGRALKAASEGKFDDAKLQLMLAKEYLSADKGYKKFLSSLSSDLDGQKIDFNSAKASMAQKLTEGLEKDVAGLSADNPAKGIFASYATTMKDKGKDITFEELQKLSDSRSVVFDIAQSDKLLSQKAHKDAKEGAYKIFERTATAFVSGDPIETVELQLYLGRRFILNKAERPDIETASAGLVAVSARIRKGELDPQSDEAQKAVGAYFAYRTLSEKYDILKEEGKKLKKGSPERMLYDKMEGELERYRKKLANGETISEEDAKKAEGYFIMFFGNKGDMLKTFGVEADGIFNTLQHVPAADRQKAAQIAMYAFEAWGKGDMQAWAIYARIVAALVSPDKKDRKAAIELAEGYHGQKVPPSKAEWYSGAYLAKATLERNIKDRKLLKKTDAYFAQVTKAYERGDLNGAQSGLDILSLFAENSALGKAADKDAAAYVDKFFGEKGVFAQAQKNGVTFAQAYAEANGMQYSQDNSAAIITGIEYETRSRRVHVSEKIFIKENDEAFLQKEKGRERQYKQERTRLETQAGKARKKGDEPEAVRLEQEASYIDYSWIMGTSENSKLLYRKGVQLFDEAIELRKKAAADPGNAQEYEAQAAEKERLAQKYISVSGTMLGGLKTFDKSVTTIFTNHRERGRENLRNGISGISDVAMGTIGTPGFTSDQDKRLQNYAAIAGLGNQEVSKQDTIQDEKRRFARWFEQMAKQSKELEKQYKDVRWIFGDTGGYNHYEYYKWGEAPPGTNWGDYKDKWKIVHSDVDVQAQIQKGKAYAHAENFGQARRIAKKTDAQLTWSSIAGRSETEYKRLKPGERPYGDYFFDVIGYEKELDIAWKDIQNGNYSKATHLMKNVSDRITVDGAKQEMDNLSWDLENRAGYIDSEKGAWERFNPFAGATLDSTAKKTYDEYLKYIKTHKATMVRRDENGVEQRVEYVPFENVTKTYDTVKEGLLDMSRSIKEEIPKVKTVQDVTLGRKALNEIQSDKESSEAFLNPYNVQSFTDQWIKNGKMTEGGQAYLMVYSGYAGTNKVLADIEQGWMITKDAYTMAVENFMPAHYLLRTGKLEKYGGNLQLASNGWLQMADAFASAPQSVDKAITSGKNVRMPEIETRKIGDVEIKRDAGITDVPSLVGALTSVPFDTYMRMSGENFLGYSGIGLWDDVGKISRESGQKLILGSWGYGFDSNGGRVIDPGRMDDTYISLPTYAGAWKKMNFSQEEKDVVLKARQGFRALNGEFFGDAIKMNDYIMTDKSPNYFVAKGRAMDDWGKAVDKIVEYQLNKDYYDSEKAKAVKKAEANRDYFFKKYQETGDYKYYDLQGRWSIKKYELEKNERVAEAQKWLDKGDARNAETKPMMKDAASTEHWAGPIKVVGYAVVIVATGGTGAFVIGFKETVGAVKSFKFQAEMAGGYDNLSTKEKVLGWGGIGLSALGAISPAFSELGLAASAPRLAAGMNWTLVGGGIALSVYQLPDLYRAWKKGEMSGLAFGANFFSNMQPALQIGIFGLAPKPIANKYLRVASALLFGMPLSEHKPPLLEHENYAVAYAKMAEYNKGAFAELETRVGGMTNDEAIGVMKYFKDTPIPLEWAEKMVLDYRKSHALPENVRPDQKGSLARFEKIPLDAFAQKYEEIVAFPEVSGWAFPKPEQRLEKQVKEEKPQPKKEEQPTVTGEFVIKPVAPEPKPEDSKVIVDMPFSERGGFTADKFAELHPLEKNGSVMVKLPDGTIVEKKVYHNIQHSENVGQTGHDLAMKRPFTENDAKVFGSKQEKAEFIGQVGLIHDADRTRDRGTQARASATLEWMDSKEGQTVMREQFKWNDSKIEMAKAMIQRTEFPFDNAKTGEVMPSMNRKRDPIPTYGEDAKIGTPDNIKTRYDKMSPQDHYEAYLSKMKPEERQFVMQEAPVLSEYADKSSWYFENRKAAFDSVTGLGTEIGMNMFAGTSGFLGSIGKESSFKTDIEIAKKFGLEMKYPGIDEVVGLMGSEAQKNWKNNKEMFERISKEGVDAKAEAKASGLDEDAQKKITQRAVTLAAGAESAGFNGDFPRDWNANQRNNAAADPAKFAVAEYMFDAALRKAGLDPDKLRNDPAYGGYMLNLMGAKPEERGFVAGKYAAELPYKIEAGKLEVELLSRNISGKVAEDAKLLLKAARGQDLDKAETGRMLKIPEDVHAQIKPNMTYEQAIAQAEKLNGMKPSEKKVPAEAPKEPLIVDKELTRRVIADEGEWMVTGKQTGAVIQAVEGWVKAEAIAGQESDVIVVTGDKRKLNQLNQLFGLGVGDEALNAYRQIFKQGIANAVGGEGGGTWLIRPSANGDEAIAIIVVPKGRGKEVRASLEKSFDKATEEVYSKTVGNPDHPLYEAGKVLRRPEDAVKAQIDISPPVEVRVVNGKVVAHYADGTEIMPEGRKGFLSIVATATEEQGSASHAPRMRAGLGVGTKAEIDYKTKMLGEGEKVSGVAFEVKLSVDNPTTLKGMKDILPTIGKGLYEVENNGFGIRGLNTFLGHYGANHVIDLVEGAVGDYAKANNLKIVRVGTLKYVIEGGTPQHAKALGDIVTGKLHDSGIKLSSSVGKVAEVKDADIAHVDNEIKNGHLGLEWKPADYTTANSVISAMAIAGDKTLSTTLGSGHGMDAIIEMVRRHPEIRNVQDIYTAFDDPAIAGKDGAAMKKTFTEYVEKGGPGFNQRLSDLSKPGDGGGGGAAGGAAGAPPPVVPFTADEAKTQASGFKLDTAEGLADFAKKVVLGDKEAVAALSRMPVEIRKEIEVFTKDDAFISIAKNDVLFKSYFEDKQGLGRQILAEYSERIGKIIAPEAQPQRMKMVGGASGYVAGEITPNLKPSKSVKTEPKVVVEPQPEQAPTVLEDLTAAAPSRFTGAKIIEVLSTEGHPDRKDALLAYSEMHISAQSAVYAELHKRARQKFIDAKAYEDAGQPDAGAHVREQGVKMQRQAMSLGELLALNGDVGKRLERSYALQEGDLAKTYIEAGSMEKGRDEVAKRLRIKFNPADPDVDHIFGMLITGDLVGVVRNLYPNAKAIEMENIGGGATGAYKVKVTDSAGNVHLEFVKKVDMNADLVGAENLKLSGIPAPDVITMNAEGQPLMYMRPDGTNSKFGISRNLGEFNGTLRMAGKDISVTTDTAVSLNDMMKSPEIMDIFINHPEVFYNELGYLNAAGFAVGAIDGHQGNVFGMILDIKNPTAENIKALKDSGVYVFTDAQGNYKMFRLGRIDTDDSAGTYWATGEKGNFDLTRFDNWMGENHVFPRIMLHLTQVRNMYEAAKAGPYVIQLPPDKVAFAQGKVWPVFQAADGSFVLQTYSPTQAKKFMDAGFSDVISRPSSEPKFVSVRDVLREGFSGGKGEFYKGLERWTSEHKNDSAYKKAMEDGFRSREGQSVGVSSFHLDGPRLQQLHEDGVTYQYIPTNGEEVTPTFYSDGRTKMMSDYEAVAVDGWDNKTIRLFPQDTPVYLAEIGKKQGKGDAGAFKVGRKWFKVYPDLESVPVKSRDKAVGAIRHHNMIRAAPGFGKSTGIKTKTIGAVHVFDYIMDMGTRGFAKEFKKIEKIFDEKEKKAETEFVAGGIGTKLLFLEDRMPIGFGPDAYPTIRP
jgi:hypothetical protein